MPLLEPIRFGVHRAGSLGGINLTPEDEESLVHKVARTGLSGLGMLGNLLDLPGSMIRDTLSWLPGGRQANPFDQLLSPLSGENRTSGRDLLSDYGLAERNKETGMAGWLDDPMEAVRDIGGFGVELATDPFMLLGLGPRAVGKGAQALKAAGIADDVAKVAAKRAKVAAKRANVALGEIGPREAGMTTKVGEMLAGATPEARATAHEFARRAGYDLTQHLDEPMRALAAVQPPFMNPLGLIGTGPKSQAVAKWLDKWSLNPFEVGSAFAKSAAGTSIRALMDASVMGKLTPEVQAHAKRTFEAQGEAIGKAKGYGAEMSRLAEQHGMTGSDAALEIRKAAEGLAANDPSGVGALLGQDSARRLQRLQSAGYGTHDLEDVVGHLLRQAGGGRAVGTLDPLSGRSSLDAAREDFLKGFHTGTVGLERVITDPELDASIQQVQNLVATVAQGGQQVPRAMIEKVIGAQITQRYGADFLPKYRATNKAGEFLFKGRHALSPTQISAGIWLPSGKWQRVDAQGMAVGEALTPLLKDRARELAKWMIDNPERRVGGLFTRHPIADAALEEKIVGIKEANANGAYEFLADHARKPDPSKASTGMRVGDILHEIGLSTNQATINFGRAKGLTAPVDLREMPAYRKELRDMEVEKQLAVDYLSPRKEFKLPDAMEYLVKKWDNFTNLFKAGVLTWPARYVRDISSGQLAAIERGMWDSGSFTAADKLIHGGTVAGAKDVPVLQNMVADRGWTLSDKTATDALRLLYAARGPGLAAQHTDVSTLKAVAPDYSGGMQEFLDIIPGHVPTTRLAHAGDVLKTIAGRTPGATWNPLDIRGIGERTETKFGLVAGGEKIGRYTDDMNRLVPFYNQLKKGVDPAEAMRRVNQLEVSYDLRSYTPTERALKRFFPFYSYTSRKIVDVGKELTTNPGGGFGQTIRAINAGRDTDELLPEHISDTAAIPLPANVSDGTKRWLTGAGLMFEDPVTLIGGPQSAGLEVLSRANPLIKGLLEWATGKTFFQKGPSGARDIADLDPTLGRILANITGQKEAVRTPDWLEVILANSPATRALTSLRQLTDVRKDWRDKIIALGTGVRISDVSPAAQDTLLRNLMTPLMREAGAKTFEKVYFPKEDLLKMEPTERFAAVKMQALINTLAKRAKERKKKADKP